jgi:predicted amidohydrolase
MGKFETFKLAGVQAAPAYFDPAASTEKACRLIEEAAANEASIVAFSETWLPGYPYWIWLDIPSALKQRMRTDYIATSVTIPGPETDQICEAAESGGIDVVIGVAERDPMTKGTVYCTLLFVSSEGAILGRHRKLKPTDMERTVWGEGDGNSLVVYDRPYGRLSGLNCWEHMMMLPGYTLAAQGTQIHVAAWPGGPDASSHHLLLSRAFALQAAAYVIDVGALMSADDLPEEYRGYTLDRPGESHIIGPSGDVIAGPVEGEAILYAEGTTEKNLGTKAGHDIGGHYSRPDVFRLQVDRSPRPNVIELNGPPEIDPADTTGDTEPDRP